MGINLFKRKNKKKIIKKEEKKTNLQIFFGIVDFFYCQDRAEKT